MHLQTDKVCHSNELYTVLHSCIRGEKSIFSGIVETLYDEETDCY